jgi:hypothetical protein
VGDIDSGVEHLGVLLPDGAAVVAARVAEAARGCDGKVVAFTTVSKCSKGKIKCTGTHSNIMVCDLCF